MTASVEPVEPALDTAPAPAPLAERSSVDQWMRRVLCLEESCDVVTESSARSLLERSLVISMVRCLLTYVVLPFVAPVVGVATGAAPAIGLVVGVVAIAFNIASIRRFWRADHRYRWHYTALSTTVIVLLVWLVVGDVTQVLTG